jgi:hypothetical protein
VVGQVWASLVFCDNALKIVLARQPGKPFAIKQEQVESIKPGFSSPEQQVWENGLVPAFSGSLDNNRCRGHSGCWLPLNPVDADVCFLCNCNCGFAACHAPATVEALAGVKPTTTLRPY